MKYLLDFNKLHIGDVILESGDTKYVSDAIKKVTKSQFSHAMLYTNHTLIHAEGGGVFSKNPQRILVSDSKHLKVLRLKGNVDPTILKSICDNAGAKVGSLYSKIEAAITVVVKNDKPAKNRKQFCSRLVAQCYEESGVSLVDNSDYCSPEDLNRSNMLAVIDDCIREATEADIVFSKTLDPNTKNQEETFKWLKEARKIFKIKKIDIQTINDVSQALLYQKDLDNKICRAIKKTKYLSLYNVDRRINKYRYDNELFKGRFSSVSNLNESLNNEIKLNKREIERHSVNLQASRENYKIGNNNFDKLHIKLYRKLLREPKKRLEIIRCYLMEKRLPTFYADNELNVVHNILK